MPSYHGLRVVWSRGQALVCAQRRLGSIELPDNGGTILGTLFDRGEGRSLRQVREADAAAITRTGGAQLIERFWGGYVAIMMAGETIRVLRDPSAAIPVYWTQTAEAYLVTSEPSLCAANGLSSLAIDWEAVAGHLLYPERRARRACLADWNELMPGERLSLDANGPRFEALWSPWQFTAPDSAIGNWEESVDLVRRAVRTGVGGWGDRYQRPLVSVSGGLDSSILVAALGRAPAGCVTISTDEAAGDERRYARLVTDRVGATLLERSFDLEQIDIQRTHAPRTPRPVARVFAQELDRLWRQTGEATCADALFHGGGGDNVFCYLTSAAPVVDSFRWRGAGADTWRTVHDVATLAEVSVATVLAASVRKALVDRGRYNWPADERLLSRAAVALGGAWQHHPWFVDQPRSVLPGKQAHVAALVRSANHLEAIEPGQDMPVVAPLLSQPIVEACLRVPTWLWCTGGINRAVARQAFSGDLPDAILGRRDKGTPDAFGAQIIDANRREILDFLHHGQLASRGFLDLAAVDGALGGGGPLRGTAYLRVSELIDVEAWLQSWGDTAGIASPAVAGWQA